MIYSTRTSRNAVIVSPDNKVNRLQRIPLMKKTFDEAWLQKLIANNPFLLQSEEIGPEFAELVCIGREVKVDDGSSTGYIDNLYVSSSGHVVIVETKLFRNQEAKRTVVAQIIDYAKEAQKWSSDDIDRIASEYTFKQRGQAFRAFDLMLEAGYLTADDSARFIDSLDYNLRKANFLLLIVGDGIRSGVEKLSDFISNFSSFGFKMALLELELYEHHDGTIVIPNVLTKTTVIERQVFTSEHPTENHTKQSARTPSAPIPSLNEFINAFAANGNYDADTISAFIANLRDVPGVSVAVHPTEVRIGAQLPDGSNCTLLRFGKSGISGKPAADIWVYPAEILNKLQKAGIGLYKANIYLDFYKTFIDQSKCKYAPYTEPASFYYGYVRRITTNADAFMEAIESFVEVVSSKDE